MSFSKEAAVGFFVMLGLVCVAYLTVKLGRMEVFHSEGYVLTASFNSVSGLRPGAEVEIAGVRVGRVKVGVRVVRFVVEHGAQHLVALLHQEAAVVPAVDGEDEVHRVLKAQAEVFAVGAARLGRGARRFWGTVEERRRNYGHRIGGGY